MQRRVSNMQHYDNREETQNMLVKKGFSRYHQNKWILSCEEKVHQFFKNLLNVQYYL